MTIIYTNLFLRQDIYIFFETGYKQKQKKNGRCTKFAEQKTKLEAKPGVHQQRKEEHEVEGNMNSSGWAASELKTSLPRPPIARSIGT